MAAFWSAAAQIAAKMDRIRAAEAKLLKLAREFGDREAFKYKINAYDTRISSQNIPLKNGSNREEKELVIHAVRVQNVTSREDNNNQSSPSTREKIPLVMQHGYMNAAAYFYRNLVGLSHHFDDIYSLDMLGWGLSSRPDFELEGEDECEAGEKFFVESLEAWREANNIPKMILAGHSFGGYMACAYCEKYPERVERLILLSPVGVPEETTDTVERRAAMRQASWRFWAFTGVAQNVFQYHSAGKVLRSMPEKWGVNLWTNYVEKRLPAISDPEEQAAISEYLYANNTLPGSGEYCLNKVLTPFAYAKNPMEFRIPHLKVKSVAFLYGQHDWMDSTGGTAVQLRCTNLQQQKVPAPEVEVYELSQAGHLLMLENWQEFNAAVILGAGGSQKDLPSQWSLPTKLDPSNFVKDQEEAWSRQRGQHVIQHREDTSSLSSTEEVSNSNGSAATASPQLSN